MSSKLYVNLNNIKYNIERIRENLKEETGIIAMVKANAYGAGMVDVTKYLETLNISDFGVALVSEGVTLRENGIKSNILVTSQFLEEDILDVINNELSVSICEVELARKLNEKAKELDKIVKVHIKIDTGMTRLGFNTEDAIKNICYIRDNFTNLIIDGIYTHLSSADTNEEYTLMQLEKFDDIYNELLDLGFKFKYVHILNSAGTFLYSKYQYTHVRIGIAMYGYLPDYSLKEKLDLKPALKLAADIIHINDVKKDTSVSYSRTYTAKSDEKIAVVQIGYADGLPRVLSNKYNTNLGKIVGNICMDMCMIKLEKDANIGDEVVIFDFTNDLEELSSICNTINYEIISGIGQRVKRVYIQ